jgi:hypothetical protein
MAGRTACKEILWLSRARYGVLAFKERNGADATRRLTEC